LDRLQLDSVDLYYLHRDDPRTPLDEIADLLHEIVTEGKAKTVGVSNWSIDRLRGLLLLTESRGLTRPAALQNSWSLAVPNWSQDGIGDTRCLTAGNAAALAGLGVVTFAYSPTASGWFAGRSAWGSYDRPDNFARRDRVAARSKETGLSPTTLALAWLVNRPCPVVPILGTGDPAHLSEALAALAVDPDLVADLDI
ncbi:MAG: aldo/keto reductase, partial [Fimbriimonadaceae bacterium]|nr:aldo/keto reductase [Fimbriimonadaceae bacterium]